MQALAAAATLSDTFTVTSADGTSQVVTVTITGSNDAPTVSAGSASATLVEAGGVANGTAGTSSATIQLTKGDVDGTASYDTTGWTSTANANQFTKSGTYGTTLYSDPTGETWIVRVAARALLLFRETEIGRIIAFTPGLSIAARCTITQNFNELVITRGDDDSCLVWDGNWTSRVEELVPASTPSGYAAMPGGHYAVAWRERTWLLSGRDDLIPSNIADSTLYKITDLLYINRGRGDRLRAAVPVGASSLLVLKSQSLHVATAVAADLSDVRVDLQPVDVQFDSPGTALAADGRVWWLDRRGVRSAASEPGVRRRPVAGAAAAGVLVVGGTG